MPVVRTDGRAYGHVITKFSWMGSLPHFLTHGAPQARFARQSSAMKLEKLPENDKLQLFVEKICLSSSISIATNHKNDF